MLFGLVMKGRPGPLYERSVRRVQWQVPEGVNVVGEYWFPTDDPGVVAIVEAEDPSAVSIIRADWDDLFDISFYPILTAEEGLELLRQRLSAQG